MKVCSKCNISKDESEFHKHVLKYDGLRSECKDCTQKWQLKHSNKNTEYYKKLQQRIKNRRFDLKKQIVDYLGGSCKLCGYKRCIKCLDPHHLDPSKKEYNIESKARLNTSIDDIKNELDKCVLLCKTCHMEVHYGFSKLDS